MDSSNRPVSPHIQIYRPQLTSVLSIFHRISGVALAFGSILIAIWLSSIAYNRELFEVAFAFLSGIWGRFFLFLWSLALFFHLCNGIRHLLWDTGHWLELEAVYKSGWGVVMGTLVLTALAWIVGYAACS